MEKIEIIKPDDWHVHFRDNEILKQLFLKPQDILTSYSYAKFNPPISNRKDALNIKKE